MILTSETRINRSPEYVWPFIEDPERMKAWNPRIVDFEELGWGARGVGFRYNVRYRKGEGVLDAFVEIDSYRVQEEYAFRLSGGQLPAGGYARVIFELRGCNEGTHVKRTIDLTHARLPRVLRIVVGLAGRVGAPAGKEGLARLKKVVEAT